MADNKKYYYMRLKENFFDTDDLKFLEAMDDGYLYSNILIKLYLKSLKYEGRLLYKDTIPYNSKMISTITNHPVGVVEKALQIFKDLELITILDGNVLYMSDIELLVGKTSTEADRKREVRKRIETGDFKGLLEEGQMSGQMSDKSIPEIRDKSLESELEKGIVNNVSLDDTYPYDRIVDYLNRRVGSSFKSTSVETRKLIKARFKQGATAEDFKTVIDKKYKQWHNNPKMVIYLRPKTLFGTKFTEYLGEAEGLVETKDSYHSNKTNRSVLDELIEKEENYSGIIGSGEVIQRNGQVLLQQSEVK